MQPDTYAAGIRRRYQDLPAEVHSWVETLLGAQVSAVRNMHGGFSPGVAAVVSAETGPDLFIKAVGGAVNADALRFYRAERDATLRIPPVEGILVPAAWADLDVNGETYAIIAFPALHGETPRHPWQPRELSAALNTVHRISEELTPSPWPDSPGDRRLLEFFTWWGAISDDAHDPWRANPWVADKLPALLAAEGQLLAELPGNTLTHTDLRADNIVMTPTGVWFVDWAHAQNAARWVDAGLLMGDVIASRADVGDGGPIDIACIIAEHPSLNTVSSETIWRLQVGLAGALHGLSRQPSPPGLPTIRSWQAATADRLIRWCQRESPLG